MRDRASNNHIVDARRQRLFWRHNTTLIARVSTLRANARGHQFKRLTEFRFEAYRLLSRADYAVQPAVLRQTRQTLGMFSR
ncbi:hypothetical protein D3C71_1810860 [compost metagenome]